MPTPLQPLRRALLGAACALLACWAPPAPAGHPEAPPLRSAADLDLRQVVAAALALHPAAGVLEARDAEAQALSRQAASLLAAPPAVELHYRTDQPGSGDGLREYEWGVSLPLLRPGQRGARQALAAGALALRVAGQVRETLGEYALRENQARLAAEQWHTARALERDVDKRVTAGELARTDLLLARDETLARQAAYLDARSALDISGQHYRALTGLAEVPARWHEQAGTESEIAGDHPRLAETLARVERARAELDAARREGSGSPELTLGTRHERDDSASPYSDTLAVSVRVPLGSRAHNAPRTAAAATALAEAQAELVQTRRELQAALDAARRRLEATRAALAVDEDRSRLAQEHLALAHKAFGLGEMDLAALLRVQSAAFIAQRNLEQRRLQLGNDTAACNQAAGQVP
jgi:outer membrane protein TolC